MALSLHAGDFIVLLMGALAVWRLTHLLHAEDGPWDLVVRLRAAAGNRQLGKIMDCFYCLSMWIALPFAGWLGNGWQQQWLLWPALSGSAILLDRITGGPTMRSLDALDAQMLVNEAAEDSLNDQEH